MEATPLNLSLNETVLISIINNRMISMYRKDIRMCVYHLLNEQLQRNLL